MVPKTSLNVIVLKTHRCCSHESLRSRSQEEYTILADWTNDGVRTAYQSNFEKDGNCSAQGHKLATRAAWPKIILCTI